jgi:hypothetical protein
MEQYAAVLGRAKVCGWQVKARLAEATGSIKKAFPGDEKYFRDKFMAAMAEAEAEQLETMKTGGKEAACSGAKEDLSRAEMPRLP